MKKTIILMLLLTFLVSCKSETTLDKDYTAEQMVPELTENGYGTIPVGDASEKIGDIAGKVGTNIPEPTVKALSGVTAFIGCMESKGAWSSNAYYHNEEIAFGLSASASMKESTDAMNLGYCAVKAYVLTKIAEMSTIGPFDPMLCNWKAKTPNDTLYNVVIVSHKGMYKEVCEKIPGGCKGCSFILRKKEE